MNEQLQLTDKTDGMEYEQHGSLAAAIASCAFKSIMAGQDFHL